MNPKLFFVALSSYVIGSVPFSYLIGLAYKKNLFKIGSHNIGTANVYRATGSIPATALALIGDLGKGALSIWMVRNLVFFNFDPVWEEFLAASFVVLGHNWPLFLQFKGGRGLASLGGVLMVLNWRLLVVSLTVIIVSILLTEAIRKRGKIITDKERQQGKSLIKILISQVKGRVIGMMLAIATAFYMDPLTIKITSIALVLVGIKHIKRTKDFLNKSQ